MAEDSMALLELVEKHGDGDFLRELGQWALQRLMEFEAHADCSEFAQKAVSGERSWTSKGELACGGFGGG